MKVLNKKFPGCFMAGTIPRSCFSPPTERKGKKPKSPSQVAENVGLEWYTPERIFSTCHLKISFKEILALVIFLKVELQYECRKCSAFKCSFEMLPEFILKGETIRTDVYMMRCAICYHL